MTASRISHSCRDADITDAKPWIRWIGDHGGLGMPGRGHRNPCSIKSRPAGPGCALQIGCSSIS